MVSLMINKIYLNDKIIQGIKKELKEKNFVLLDSFFDSSFYEKIKKESAREEFKKKFVYNKYSFLEMQSKKIEKDFLSAQFIEFLEEVLNLKIKNFEISIRKFGHGDYTLLHDSEKEKSKIGFLFFICDDWNLNFGGNVFYKEKNLIVNPKENRFFVMKKSSRKFVKYLNNKCGKKNFVLIEGRVN